MLNFGLIQSFGQFNHLLRDSPYSSLYSTDIMSVSLVYLSKQQIKRVLIFKRRNFFVLLLLFFGGVTRTTTEFKYLK